MDVLSAGNRQPDLEAFGEDLAAGMSLRDHVASEVQAVVIERVRPNRQAGSPDERATSRTHQFPRNNLRR